VADPLSPEFDIVVDEGTYTFRKPTIRYLIELGFKAADVRRRAFPQSGGVLPIDFGVDRTTVEMATSFAILELYLVRSDQTWCFSPGPDGKPIVDFTQFPFEYEDTVWRIRTEFDKQVDRFRKRGDPPKPRIGEQAVGSQ
jgi:hypothetical protein